ncbi:MAG: CinA family protein [Sulfitobacter sp.]
MSLAVQILSQATQKGLIITCAESCTGGMVAAALTDLPGSSAMFDRGFVTYTNAAKIEMLGVTEVTLRDHGAVSEQTALEMAQGALARSGAQIAVSITGIAGPGGSDHKPEGRVCFGVVTTTTHATEMQDLGALGRDAVRTAARDHALALILAAIGEVPHK